MQAMLDCSYWVHVYLEQMWPWYPDVQRAPQSHGFIWTTTGLEIQEKCTILSMFQPVFFGFFPRAETDNMTTASQTHTGCKDQGQWFTKGLIYAEPSCSDLKALNTRGLLGTESLPKASLPWAKFVTFHMPTFQSQCTQFFCSQTHSLPFCLQLLQCCLHQVSAWRFTPLPLCP